MSKKYESSIVDRQGLFLEEIVKAEVFRGRPGGYLSTPDEEACVEDLIVDTGRIFLAQRINGGDTIASAMLHMAVGTVATAPVLGNTQITGEVDRKAMAISSATDNNLYTGIATWGGAADSVTSLVIAEAGIFNHAASGQATMFQRVTFSTVTLADSDLLKLTLETRVGSNTI